MKNKIEFKMPPKSLVMDKLSDIGVSNDLYYSKNLFARIVFRNRIKYALNMANPINKVVLDIGCGAGFMAYNLSENGAKTIASDLRTKLNKSNSFFNYLLSCPKIEFNNADIFHLPFKSKSFDIVYALDMLEHLKNAELALIEIKRVLKNDGSLIVSIPNENIFYRIGRKISVPKKTNHALFSNELIQLLNSFFEKTNSISITPLKLFYINSYIKSGMDVHCNKFK
jgi:2-polyprenyl-3-methyl-5-hydroxy-6-metoxy-1,4-benzoquinol methylase